MSEHSLKQYRIGKRIRERSSEKKHFLLASEKLKAMTKKRLKVILSDDTDEDQDYYSKSLTINPKSSTMHKSTEESLIQQETIKSSDTSSSESDIELKFALNNYEKEKLLLSDYQKSVLLLNYQRNTPNDKKNTQNSKDHEIEKNHNLNDGSRILIPGNSNHDPQNLNSNPKCVIQNDSVNYSRDDSASSCPGSFTNKFDSRKNQKFSKFIQNNIKSIVGTDRQVSVLTNRQASVLTNRQASVLTTSTYRVKNINFEDNTNTPKSNNCNTTQLKHELDVSNCSFGPGIVKTILYDKRDNEKYVGGVCAETGERSGYGVQFATSQTKNVQNTFAYYKGYWKDNQKHGKGEYTVMKKDDQNTSRSQEKVIYVTVKNAESYKNKVTYGEMEVFVEQFGKVWYRGSLNKHFQMHGKGSIFNNASRDRHIWTGKFQNNDVIFENSNIQIPKQRNKRNFSCIDTTYQSQRMIDKSTNLTSKEIKKLSIPQNNKKMTQIYKNTIELEVIYSSGK